LRVDLPEGPRHLLPRAAPLYAGSGEIDGVVFLLHDVTRMAHAGQLADDLVATVAHELKTPLTSLHMAVHLCLEGLAGPLSDKQSELLHGAREDCERIRGLVDEILDVARLQSGRARLERGPVDAAIVVADVIAAHAAAAERGRVELVAECLPGCPTVLADRERIGLTLANLVANAIRHTPEGGRVTVGCSPAEDGVRLEITDDGPGIPAEHRTRIFERFFQIPGRARGGGGLGLTIAKEVIEAHGGRIAVEDTPDRGARFSFTIPG
jgi:signal transduction histidine kinase